MIIRWERTLGLLLVLLYIAIAKQDVAKEQFQCPVLSECPFRADPCEDDDQCSPDSMCCNSPCGKVCTKQLFTGCQTLRMAASRRAKSLGVEPKRIRMPRCNKSGGFETVQCDNEIVSSCWCVDESGFEMPGTRAPAASLVNCTAPKACADHTCRMFCPHGFALTKDGCPLCRCRDPCDDIKCPNALECHLEDLACLDPPCPPVPTCKRGRSLDNICPVGDPLRISDSVRPFLCGTDPSKPTCPPMYQCLVQKGNDYGVCCPASLKITKTGTCPTTNELNFECGSLCTHDLECPSIQKCCNTEQCGNSCMHPTNITECLHQQELSKMLSINERTGRGYIPQCSQDGHFEPKQCSRNGLVCWCVDRMGRKIKGSMGASGKVNCSLIDSRVVFSGRSLNNKNGKKCESLECAAVCEYGFKLDDDNCPTCKCEDPCEGYLCGEDEECINVKDSTCTDFLCPTLPVCRPITTYSNPCQRGTPLINDLTGSPIICSPRSRDDEKCPTNYECTQASAITQPVCCLMDLELEADASNEEENIVTQKPQSMCEYLHEFSDSMEGTREGMRLAIPSPSCNSNGDFLPMQCHNSECWCVDYFGTEIPKSRGLNNATKDCENLRQSMDCLDLTCRMGCEYGFILSEETGCPLCQCRDPCTDIKCKKDEQCQLVEVSCKDHYCPPVPACLPKKIGQCPYLMPTTSVNCDFECNSDMVCNGTMRCCSNGCGTQCIEPLLLTACQHQRIVIQHHSIESGIPAGKLYVPQCKKNGIFEPKQCNPGLNECWCVDYRGFEISKTRTRDKSLSCDQSPRNDCPLYKCLNDCEHGFVINDKGCRTCECIDPCSKISCKGEGEVCRLMSVECINEPCPPIPMCLPKKENPCQSGEPLKLGDELVNCGPDFENCPSSHKCQLSPVGEYAVCCPKPREVCFEAIDKGKCDNDNNRNLTRYYFNSKNNRCEPFLYSGCKGNHNNFHTEEMCNFVCPVLSQCERLREKNQQTSIRYKKSTFMPRCESNSGAWKAVQCLEYVGVCWCVTPQGEPLKGTLTRNGEPICNFRQARQRTRNRSDILEDADLILEELMMQIGGFNENIEKSINNSIENWEIPLNTRCQALGGQCDEDGRFLPMQCEEESCWCVDLAGNQLPHTNTFKKGEHVCVNTPVIGVEVTLGFRGEFDEKTIEPVFNKIYIVLQKLNGTLDKDGLKAEKNSDILYIKFNLIGNNKVDVAYKLEQMVMHQSLPGLVADITRSRVTHRILLENIEDHDRIMALEHREIVSQSPVSIIAPYHTALIVIAAASAFVISVLTLLVILYKKKMNSLNNNKRYFNESEFLPNNRPIYIELPNEKSKCTSD